MNAPEKLFAGAEPHVMKTYGRLPMALSHGRGCWVWDTEGKKYLDGLAGIAIRSTRSSTARTTTSCRFKSSSRRSCASCPA